MHLFYTLLTFLVSLGFFIVVGIVIYSYITKKKKSWWIAILVLVITILLFIIWGCLRNIFPQNW